MSKDAPGAFDKVTYHGKLMDKKTRAAVMEAEEILGYQLTIIQGSYNPGGVGASGGTHDGSGVLDLAAYDAARKLRVLKDVGFFIWYRAPIASLWGEHLHGGLRNHGRLSASAARQQVSYDHHRSGLVSNKVDPTYRADPSVVYVYDPRKDVVVPTSTNVTKMRDAVVEAKAANSRAIAFAGKAIDRKRPVITERNTLIRINKRYDEILATAPKR